MLRKYPRALSKNATSEPDFHNEEEMYYLISQIKAELHNFGNLQQGLLFPVRWLRNLRSHL